MRERKKETQRRVFICAHKRQIDRRKKFNSSNLVFEKRKQSGSKFLFHMNQN